MLGDGKGMQGQASAALRGHLLIGLDEGLQVLLVVLRPLSHRQLRHIHRAVIHLHRAQGYPWLPL